MLRWLVPLFDWDHANISHIARHKVTTVEAEQAVSTSIQIGWEEVEGEMRIEEVGRTSKWRIITVVTTERLGKTRVVTAYDAPSDDKKLYWLSMVTG